MHACVCIHNHILDMYGPILFVLSTKTTHVWRHKHIILFRDAIKDGRLAATLVVQSFCCFLQSSYRRIISENLKALALIFKKLCEFKSSRSFCDAHNDHKNRATTTFSTLNISQLTASMDLKFYAASF